MKSKLFLCLLCVRLITHKRRNDTLAVQTKTSMAFAWHHYKSAGEMKHKPIVEKSERPMCPWEMQTLKHPKIKWSDSVVSSFGHFLFLLSLSPIFPYKTVLNDWMIIFVSQLEISMIIVLKVGIWYRYLRYFCSPQNNNQESVQFGCCFQDTYVSF